MLPEDEYTSYIALQQLSRRSRYLVNEKNQATQDNEKPCLTSDRHLSKACRHLDKLLTFFATRYQIDFDKIDLAGTELSIGENLIYLRPKSKATFAQLAQSD